MNKTILTIAVLGLLTLLTSAYYSAPADSRIGFKSPSLELGSDNNSLSPLMQHRGEIVLLTFWASADAESRLHNMHYDRLSRRDGVGFCHVSINLDRNVSVFNSIVTIDNLDRTAHFSTSLEIQENVKKAWRLDDGFHSFLLDQEGRIIAVDPDESTLMKVGKGV